MFFLPLLVELALAGILAGLPGRRVEVCVSPKELVELGWVRGWVGWVRGLIGWVGGGEGW